MLRRVLSHLAAIAAARRLVQSFLLVALVVLALSCSDDTVARPQPSRIGSVAQAFTDEDGDGLDDDWERAHFLGSLSQGAAGDYDLDGMTNLEEYTHGFNPTVNDSYDDADFDRYPNIFELRGGSDPNLASSVPAPTYTVDPAGGGSHTTIGAAVGAANVADGNYQIIGISAGVYKGAANCRDVSIASSKPKLLMIGLSGAANTVIDGELANWGWVVANSSVIASLTFKKTWAAVYVDAAGQEVRLVDVLMRENANAGYAAGVHIYQAGHVRIIGSTFLDNVGVSYAEQIWVGATTATITNTAVTGASSSAALMGVAGGATLTTS